MDIIHIILNDNAVMATLDKKNARLNICQQCENLNNNICKQCGCLVEVRSAYEDAFCPLRKWDVDSL